MKISRRKFVRSGALWLLAAPQIIVPARAQMGRSPAFKAAAALQGQPAGGPTTLFSDDFNRSNSTNLGTNWTEVEDNSSISSNQLLLGVGGFSSVITTTNAHADTANITATAKHVSATVDGGITGGGGGGGGGASGDGAGTAGTAGSGTVGGAGGTTGGGADGNANQPGNAGTANTGGGGGGQGGTASNTSGAGGSGVVIISHGQPDPEPPAGDETAPEITLVWPATDIPVFISPLVYGELEASDNVAVVNVAWTNALTTATGQFINEYADVWTGYIGLSIRTNPITLTASDAAGNQTSTNFTLIFEPRMVTADRVNTQLLRIGD